MKLRYASDLAEAHPAMGELSIIGITVNLPSGLVGQDCGRWPDANELREGYFRRFARRPSFRYAEGLGSSSEILLIVWNYGRRNSIRCRRNQY